MTSLFSRLQKLNKDGTKAPWAWEYAGTVGKMGEAEIYGEAAHPDEGVYIGITSFSDNEEGSEKNAALIVECRNSLPAVLNLIEAAREHLRVGDDESADTLEAAVNVFVSEESQDAAD